LIERHGTDERISPFKISVTPNFYIIATQNNMPMLNLNSQPGLQRMFYMYQIKSNYEYILDDKGEIIITDDKKDSRWFYHQSNEIIKEKLSFAYKNNKEFSDEFYIGHGMLSEKNYKRQMKYQVIPLMKQYVKDFILEATGYDNIMKIENDLKSKYSKTTNPEEFTRIRINKTDITAANFFDEGETHKPLINLVRRFKAQGLLTDIEIEKYILFNKNILYRTGNNGEIGFLFISQYQLDEFLLGKRRLYKSRDKLMIGDDTFCVAGEMQPKEYNRWAEEFLDNSYVNDKKSTSPNSLLFLMIKNYYEAILKKYDEFLNEHGNDINIKFLKLFYRHELGQFIQETKSIIPASGDAEDNLAANEKLRTIISGLKLLWIDTGDKVNYDSNEAVMEGVYKVNELSQYKEYYTAMKELKTNQIVLQGPPGTSKTYTTKRLLKFLGKGTDNNDFLSDAELSHLQITDYTDVNAYSEWKKENNEENAKIAWDIVQFHPSYGYEDFVRGIEVTTSESTGNQDSSIVYRTVDKILGKIANLASKHTETDFFLVVDEINRANLATVFGELIYGLEYRDEKVATPYFVENDNKLSLPDNLYIIGTMNTADKSIGGIDYAIRRRFLFFPLLPDEVIIREYRTNDGEPENNEEIMNVNEKAVRLFNKVSTLFTDGNLNSEYYQDDVQLGHTYFLVDNEEQLYLRFKHQILPILKEYFKDGMFAFDTSDEAVTGWEGFLNCITGKTNIHRESVVIKNIFDTLIMGDEVIETE
jgi:MoxR-like ATPase